MKTLTIIGGSGFLGSALSDLLAKKNYKVVIFDIKKKTHLKANQKFIRGSILNIKKLMGERFDVMTATNVTIASMMTKAGYSINDVKNLYTFMNVGVYFAFSKEVPFEVVDTFRKEFEKLRSTCELQKIRNKWCWV